MLVCLSSNFYKIGVVQFGKGIGLSKNILLPLSHHPKKLLFNKTWFTGAFLSAWWYQILDRHLNPPLQHTITCLEKSWKLCPKVLGQSKTIVPIHQKGNLSRSFLIKILQAISGAVQHSVTKWHHLLYIGNLDGLTSFPSSAFFRLASNLYWLQPLFSSSSIHGLAIIPGMRFLV